MHELLEWRAFWKLKAEAEKKSMEKAQREARTKRTKKGR